MQHLFWDEFFFVLLDKCNSLVVKNRAGYHLEQAIPSTAALSVRLRPVKTNCNTTTDIFLINKTEMGI